MVQKQHSKTSRGLFSLKKGEPSESSNIIQRIASPLGRFHAGRNHTSPTALAVDNDPSETETEKSIRKNGSSKRKRRKPKKSLSRFSRDKYEDSVLPAVDLASFAKGQTESSRDGDESSVEASEKETKQEVSSCETSESASVSESSTSYVRSHDIPKLKNIFRRSILPTKEETPRLSSTEKNIENARKNFLRGFVPIARSGLETEIHVVMELMKQNSPRHMGSSRLPYTLACAYHYLACVEMSEKEYEKAEKSAREALAILDDLILNDPPIEKKRINYSDSWLTGQDATNIMLWVRKATVENQLGTIMIEQQEKELGLEWLQRAICSREQHALMDGMPITYISISTVLVDSVKDQFNSLKQLLYMVWQKLILKRFVGAVVITAIVNYYVKGIKLCKKVVDDNTRLNGLSTLYEVKAIQTQMSSMQEQYLRGNASISSTTSLTNEKRHKKMENILVEIEKARKKLGKDKSMSKQSLGISETTLPQRRLSSIDVELSHKDSGTSPRNKVRISKSQNSLIHKPVEL